jgi:arabinose-5-phosphate isomerase
MQSHCKTTSADVLAAEALHILEENKITSLLVAENKQLVGALNIHDLFREGLM